MDLRRYAKGGEDSRVTSVHSRLVARSSSHVAGIPHPFSARRQRTTHAAVYGDAR